MSLYDYVRNNFWMKVFALALAVLIYFAVQSVLLDDPSLIWNPLNNQERKTYTVPVRLVITAEQGQGFKVTPPNVNVTLGGDRSVLKDLSTNRILAYARVDTAKSPLGGFQVECLPIKEIEIRSIMPQRVDVETIPSGVMLFPLPPETEPNTNAPPAAAP